MEDQIYGKYKDMLISVADIVDEKNSVLETMKFKCDGFIKGRERDQIKSAIQLWTALEKREYLGPSNTTFLKDLLKSCMRGNVEALIVLENYEQLNGGLPNNFNLQQNLPTNIAGNPHIIIIQQDNHHKVLPKQQYRQDIGPDLTAEFSFLTNSLGRNWPFFMLELGVPESELEVIRADYRYTKEQIHQCLITWKDLKKHEATKDSLIKALRAVDRKDLAEELKEGTY